MFLYQNALTIIYHIVVIFPKPQSQLDIFFRPHSEALHKFQMFSYHYAMKDPVRKRVFDYQIELHQKGRTCEGCSGICCTDKHNSMMVNKEEAALIFDYLKTRPNLDEMMAKVTLCIREYRLDFIPPGLKGQTLRKKYTCPFFSGGEFGCQLPFEIKPLGCLMFNPVSGGKKGEDCRSEFGPIEDQKQPVAGQKKFSIPYALELVKTGTWPE